MIIIIVYIYIYIYIYIINSLIFKQNEPNDRTLFKQNYKVPKNKIKQQSTSYYKILLQILHTTLFFCFKSIKYTIGVKE